MIGKDEHIKHKCDSIWLLKNMITSNGGKRRFRNFHYACEACDLSYGDERLKDRDV
jgi:hypothetical protein